MNPTQHAGRDIHIKSGIQYAFIWFLVVLPVPFIFSQASMPGQLDVFVDSIGKNIETNRFAEAQKSIQALIKKVPSDSRVPYYEAYFKGMIFAEMKRYPEALDFFNLAEFKAHQLGMDDLLFDALNEKGNLFSKSGSDILAFEVMRESLILAKRNQNKKELVLATNGLGHICFRLGRFKDGLAYFESANRQYMKLDKGQSEMNYWVQNGLIDIGLCYAHLGDTVKAVQYYQRAIAACNSSNNFLGASVAQVNLGKILAALKQYQRAYDMLLSSVKNVSVVDVEYYDHASQVNFEMARVLMRMGNEKLAESHLNTGFKFMQNGKQEFLPDYYCLRSELLEHQGQIEKSYQVLKHYVTLSDSMRKAEWMEMQIREGLGLEFQRKVVENNLRKKNTELISIKESEAQFYFGFLGFVLLLLGGSVVYYRRNGLQLQGLNANILQHQLILKSVNQTLYKVNSQKDMIMATVAHDLRGLIGGLLFGARNLKRMLHQPEKNVNERIELIDLMDHASNHALQIVQDLVDAKELEDKSLKLKIQPTLLIRLINDAWEAVKYLAIPKKIKIELDVDEDLVVQVDGERFSRVLQNLLSNALKFSYPEDKIWVSTKKEVDGLVIVIEDEGVGISQSDILKIFEPYFKGVSGTNGEKTTGLGLSIVKQIVELHHGQVWVESQPNNGTRFFIRIPIASQ